ncbi:hypothetical protein AUJ66_02445 [Candidatus Desantisbacteria bacterium CG1_02_38_46]|uniref:AAA+ ATPase domain-containing protein n=3 Tax=unclassified Candidatus Desantisiibacteriota TaxID=3106372 RepID=A0A2H9PCX8_9BACT|nr:MAG: hypothetical protein AUJ66_02445 [Candidatus Desantisbacteria bacterium CG1_02_38_46]PIU51121.1 MAG: hypothetical protein COS91_06200 [Candidatus Desantisbacteria bacterium CG07_land_8_20_14_0_80_39_15]PIZ16387.1 MAG: hypothetical protein COY51_02870 [Candidatus Desantisbacteria bacterium CG_4_10_14_0_8_um_filter_39_17]
MEIRQELARQNPWWTNPSSIDGDPYLKALESSPFKWTPRIKNEISLDGEYIYTLRGCRQVGKTTLIKSLIKELLENQNFSKDIFYFPLDLVNENELLLEILRTYLKLFPPKGRRYIFLDEITNVPEWQKAIKYLKDSAELQNTCLVLTGSSAADIRRGAERLPGRRGKKTELDKVLFPLSFSEFAISSGVKLPGNPGQFSLSEMLFSENFWKTIEETFPFLDKFQEVLEKYLVVGGLPVALRDFLQLGGVSNITHELYRAAIMGELEKWGKSYAYTFGTLRKIKESLTTPLSWDNLARGSGIVGGTTAKDYAELLAESFLLFILYFLDPSKRKQRPVKGKKIYFADPLIYHLVSHTEERRILSPESPPIFLTSIEQGQLIENLIGMHIYRSVERDPNIPFMPQDLFCWHSKKGREIDFLAREGEFIAIETKYQSHISGSDLLTMRNTFKKGLVVSRDVLEEKNGIRIIPASLFLWFLKLRA